MRCLSPRTRSAKFFHPDVFSANVREVAGIIAIDAEFDMIKVGDLINDTYHLLRVLGEGGMGIVFEACDMKLDALVAIKFMKPEVLADREIVERFMREARALAKLKSHHAVKVYNLGTHQGMPFIVMEHLEGIAVNKYLDDRCRDGRGPLPPGEAAWLLWQACEAIAEAHTFGIYHRDIKPANMFLAKGASEKNIVKVLDFGIAKMVRHIDDTVRKDGDLTGTYMVMGTPRYMSPEQMMSTRNVDGRSDIWSLGVVLYELVSAEFPFEGGTLYELQHAIIKESPIRRDLPPTVDSIVQRCLSKDPKNRYQSVNELRLALNQLVAEPTESAPGLFGVQNPEPTQAGGTVVMNPGRTITVLPPVAKFAPDTASNAVTRPIEPTSPSPNPANPQRRTLVMAAIGVVVMAFAIGGTIFGIRTALSNETGAPAASIAAARSEATPAPPRTSGQGESSTSAAPTTQSATPSASATQAIPISPTASTPPSTSTSVRPPTAKITSPTPVKKKRDE